MKPTRRQESMDYTDMTTSPTNVMIPTRYKRMLRHLSNKTRIRQAEYIREAFKDLLIKYRKEFHGSEFEF